MIFEAHSPIGTPTPDDAMVPVASNDLADCVARSRRHCRNGAWLDITTSSRGAIELVVEIRGQRETWSQDWRPVA